jgi:hypothetical protein
MTAVAARRKLRTWLAQPTFVKLWAGPVWLVLGLAKLAIRLLSFKRLAGFMGASQGVEPWVPLASPQQQRRARLIGRTIGAVAKNTPWESNCFPQALTARLLLGLYGIPHAVYFGLARGPEREGLQAHAWVACDRIPVTGGAGFCHFTAVGMFVPTWLAPEPA